MAQTGRLSHRLDKKRPSPALSNLICLTQLGFGINPASATKAHPMTTGCNEVIAQPSPEALQAVRE